MLTAGPRYLYSLFFFFQFCQRRILGKLFYLEGIRIILSNTSFLLLKYTYIQGYVFQLLGAIIRAIEQIQV